MYPSFNSFHSTQPFLSLFTVFNFSLSNGLKLTFKKSTAMIKSCTPLTVSD